LPQQINSANVSVLFRIGVSKQDDTLKGASSIKFVCLFVNNVTDTASLCNK